MCNQLPAILQATLSARWHAQDAFYDDALVVRFPELTLQQREMVVAAYNKHYGPIAATYEQLYAGGYCKDNLDGIMFNKGRFCKNILDDLVKVNAQRSVNEYPHKVTR